MQFYECVRKNTLHVANDFCSVCL